MMKRAEILLYYFCTGLTLCILYATQPIGPIFESELGISKTQAALFTTAIMTPLAFAGIFYGYLLEKIAIKSKARAVAFNVIPNIKNPINAPFKY